jgi:hypothetical protein
MMMGSGKTSAGEHLVALAPDGDLIANRASAALLPRLREADMMYVLGLDEVEKTLKSTARTEDQIAPILAMLNSGYKHSGHSVVLDQVQHGDTVTWEATQRSTYGAMLLIGTAPNLPLDLVSRSLTVTMVRAQPGTVQPTRWHLIEDHVADLREGLIAATAPLRDTLREAPVPEWVPTRAFGRPEERWLSLALIAEAAGGPWPGRVLDMIEADLDAIDEAEDDNTPVNLIRDCYEAFRDADALTPTELAGRLAQIRPHRWGMQSGYGRAISARTMSTHLGAAGIRSAKRNHSRVFLREAFGPSWLALDLGGGDARGRTGTHDEASASPQNRRSDPNGDAGTHETHHLSLRDSLTQDESVSQGVNGDAHVAFPASLRPHTDSDQAKQGGREDQAVRPPASPDDLASLIGTTSENASVASRA